jgi:hypothetical protein
MKLIEDLYESHNISMNDGEKVFVRKCPKCHNGNVLTQCNQGIEHGNKFWHFNHYCDACSEKFVLSRLRSDIFFHKPFKIFDNLETPFGSIKVKLNEKDIHFHCRNQVFEDAEFSNGKPLLVQIIDIDMSEYKQGDIIFCGFDQELLDFNESDERSVIYSCENSTLLLGVCAYDPDEWELNNYCYQLEDQDRKGFSYKVKSNPKEFDVNEFYQSVITSLAVAWIRKDDFNDPDDAIFSLTCIIG